MTEYLAIENPQPDERKTLCELRRVIYGTFNKDDEQDVALTDALETLERILVPVIRYESSNNESKK